MNDIIQLFAECISFVYSSIDTKNNILHLETENNMNEYSEDGEIDDYTSGISKIIVNKDTKTFNLSHTTNDNTEEICNISILELSKILQVIREYKDAIVGEINKGYVSWD